MVAIPLGRRKGGRFVGVTRPDGAPVVSVVASNRERLTPWRTAITTNSATNYPHEPYASACSVTLAFKFTRPKNHYGTGKNSELLKPTAEPRPITRSQGDIDKLTRAVLDALTDAKVLTDDSIVTALQSTKQWARDGTEGVHITVTPEAA